MNLTMTDLRIALLDLVTATGDPELRLMIGGGYGIFLKYHQVLEAGTQTLLEERPEARSTNDIDIFLRTELLVNGERLEPLKAALQSKGYEPVKGAECYQFAKPGPGGGKAGALKVDLLAGTEEALRSQGLKVDERRVRAKNLKKLHAHPVNEAPTLELRSTELVIEGQLPTGEAAQVKVLLPHPFSFVTMKLFALRDRVDDQEKGFGSHHAMDLYMMFALMSEKEWKESLQFQKDFAENDFVQEAGKIVAGFFLDENAMGMIRLREHAYYTANLQLSEFREALMDLFGVQAQPAHISADLPPR